jgi:hypothetical protein
VGYFYLNFDHATSLFSLSLSITNTPAAAYNIQPTATPAFSFPVSTTIPHLTILEFIFGQ